MCCVILLVRMSMYTHMYVCIYALCSVLYACSRASAVSKHHCCLSFSLLQFLSVCALPCHLQVLCLSKQILFTQCCEEATSGGSLQELLIELEA